MFFFFFNDTATTEIYTLSLHDALPILPRRSSRWKRRALTAGAASSTRAGLIPYSTISSISRALSRSEEHTSELQSRPYLVCRLLLEKKKKKITKNDTTNIMTTTTHTQF